MSDYIEVDGLRVGPCMWRSKVEEVEHLRARVAVQASSRAISSCSEIPNSSGHASRQGVEGEPVAVVDRVGIMQRLSPYTNLPEGTKLYTHPASADKQAVYSLVGHFYNRPSEGRIGIEWCCDSLDDGQELYAKQEQDHE